MEMGLQARPPPVASGTAARAAGLFAVLAIVLTVAVAAPGWAQRGSAAACENPATPVEAQAMAERAARHLLRVGIEQAFGAFMNPAGAFIERDLYVFVLDFQGTVWVNGGYPELIGSNALDARDYRGRAFIAEALKIAREEGQGWIEYAWLNPCNDKMSEKSSYIIRVGRLIVGVGAYGSVGA